MGLPRALNLGNSFICDEAYDRNRERGDVEMKVKNISIKTSKAELHVEEVELDISLSVVIHIIKAITMHMWCKYSRFPKK